MSGSASDSNQLHGLLAGGIEAERGDITAGVDERAIALAGVVGDRVVDFGKIDVGLVGQGGAVAYCLDQRRRSDAVGRVAPGDVGADPGRTRLREGLGAGKAATQADVGDRVLQGLGHARPQVNIAVPRKGEARLCDIVHQAGDGDRSARQPHVDIDVIACNRGNDRVTAGHLAAQSASSCGRSVRIALAFDQAGHEKYQSEWNRCSDDHINR